MSENEGTTVFLGVRWIGWGRETGNMKNQEVSGLGGKGGQNKESDKVVCTIRRVGEEEE